jgi:protein-S-isoprenylcysteine O-methyltransferase Ste14
MAPEAQRCSDWIAGPSYLVAFAILVVFRVHAEERMMLEQFGDEYEAYTARSQRLVPRVW